MALPGLPPPSSESGSSRDAEPPARSYRTLSRSGPDPVTEADAIIELLSRSNALRRRLLMANIAASVLGGVLGLSLYLGTALRVYGRMAGFFYAAGAVVTFAVGRRLCSAVARAREARWSAELARQHQLDEGPLIEATALFE